MHEISTHTAIGE